MMTPNTSASTPPAAGDWALDLTLIQLVEAIRSKRVTPLEVIQACFVRIHRLNPTLNALVCLREQEALQEAEEQTRKILRGEPVGLLSGVPLAVKDLEDVKGLPTTYGARLFRDNVAQSDSVQVARLRAQGAIIIGKTNTPIFGTQAYSANLLFGPTRNPWDPSLTPGGSSGGSSALIAARITPLVTSADGGGSIRIPATFVGAFGFKPTYGRIPCDEMRQFGMVKILHCVHFGPLTRSVEDAALFLDITAGYHPADPFSLPKPEGSYLELLRNPRPKGRGKNGALKIGFSADLGYVSGCQADIMRQVRQSLKTLASLGHEVVEQTNLVLPDLGMSWAMGMGAQTYMTLGKAVEGREELLEKGMVDAWGLLKNLSVDEIGDIMRDLYVLNKALEAFFAEFDILVTPAMGIDPFNAAGPMPKKVEGKDLDSLIHAVGYCYPFNFSGHPACVLRCGLSDAGLPVGVQFVCERQADGLLLQLAKQFQDRTGAFESWPNPKL